MRALLPPLAALLLVACSAAPTGSDSSESRSLPVVPDAGAWTVTISDHGFEPEILEIPLGGAVVWEFAGSGIHSTRSDSRTPLAWNSQLLPAGSTFRVRFLEVGEYPYHCGPHPFMKGRIIVR